MKGLVVWAQSVCRSTMGLYRELGKQLGVELVVPLWHYNVVGEKNIRTIVGFSSSEFKDIKTIPVGEDYRKGLEILNTYKGYHHIFCIYQGSRNFRKLLNEVHRRGERVIVGCESPCNMSNGWRKLAKEIYFRTKLPWSVRKTIKNAEFFVNYSGNDDALAKMIGWPSEKIIPFGYFPPSIPGTQRLERNPSDIFEILSTGLMTWHRGSDILVRALSVLKNRGVNFHATITQNGPLYEHMKAFAEKERLPIDFVGFLPMEKVHFLYEHCSVFVGAGRHEPWGMRLNDALNCGAPLIVNRGMGGVKMVDDYGCGLAFRNEDPEDLADKISRLIANRDLYLQCARNAIRASDACLPSAKASELIKILHDKNWL